MSSPSLVCFLLSSYCFLFSLVVLFLSCRYASPSLPLSASSFFILPESIPYYERHFYFHNMITWHHNTSECSAQDSRLTDCLRSNTACCQHCMFQCFAQEAIVLYFGLGLGLGLFTCNMSTLAVCACATLIFLSFTVVWDYRPQTVVNQTSLLLQNRALVIV